MLSKGGRVFLSLVLLSGILVTSGCQGEKQPETVKLGYVQWATEVASTNVVKKAMEEQLGVEVEITPVDAAIMWQGVANGDFDAMVAAWLPGTHADYLEKTKDKLDNLGPNLEGTRIGLVVPTYVTIGSIEDLNSAKDKFAGKIVGIDPGAGIMSATERAVDEYGLDYELIESSGAAMTAALADAVRNDEWIVVTGWTPHWKFQKWDLKYLHDPKNVYGGEEYIATVARKGLEKDKPKVYKFLDNFHWNVSDMESVMVDIQGGMDPDEAAQKWVNDNKDKVEAWAE